MTFLTRSILGFALLAGIGCGGGNNTGDAGTDVSSTTDAGPGGLPSGPQIAVAKPSTAPTMGVGGFGSNIALVTDANNDPALAYVWTDPNNDGNDDDSTVWFTAWNRNARMFSPPVLVGTTGTQQGNATAPVALAYDASTHAFGLAFQAQLYMHSGLDFAYSTDHGATWATHPIATGMVGTSGGNPMQTSIPVLTMASGNAYVTYTANPNGIIYATGAEASDPATWTSTSLMAPTGYIVVNDRRAGLALDGAGMPAVAYWVEASGNEHDNKLTFWRPGSTTLTTIATNNDNNSLGAVYLGFGTVFRAIFEGQAPAPPATETDYQTSTSADGVTWTPVAYAPTDLGAGAGLSFAAAVASHGQGALLYQTNSGNGMRTCGNPKLSRVTVSSPWTTCSPDTASTLGITPVPSSVAAAFGTDDTLYVAFTNSNDPAGMVPPGIVVWRQP